MSFTACEGCGTPTADILLRGLQFREEVIRQHRERFVDNPQSEEMLAEVLTVFDDILSHPEFDQTRNREWLLCPICYEQHEQEVLKIREEIAINLLGKILLQALEEAKQGGPQ